MIQLHYYPGNASFAPHLLLEELGTPFELQYVDRTVGAHKAPAYLKLNPNGLIPVLVDGDLVLYETAAICLHLADTHPKSGFAPNPGTPAGIATAAATSKSAAAPPSGVMIAVRLPTARLSDHSTEPRSDGFSSRQN